MSRKSGRQLAAQPPACPATGRQSYRSWNAAERLGRPANNQRISRCRDCGHYHISDMTAAEYEAWIARTQRAPRAVDRAEQEGTAA